MNDNRHTKDMHSVQVSTQAATVTTLPRCCAGFDTCVARIGFCMAMSFGKKE